MSFSDPRVAEAFALLPQYLGAHVVLSTTSLALGLLLSLPLAVLGVLHPRLRGPLLGTASVIQTIPSLALLALFYPLLLALSAASDAAFGAQFSALGFLPSVLALTLYSMLPILRNTVTGLLAVDPAIKEAAEGVGMTRMQSLLRVELPLAAPMIMAGIRTASVWVIGAATLSTPVGQTSLGNYIFTGLQTQNWIFVLFGCVAAAGLALVVDQLLAAVERTIVGRRKRAIAAGALAGVAVAAGFAFALAGSADRYVVGAKGFAEQYVLAALITERLEAAGLPATEKSDLGSAVIFDALVGDDVDAYVDYTGTIWTNEMHRSDTPPRAVVLRQVAAWLANTYGVTLLGPLGFENAYALAMPRDRAEALGIKTIADLAALSPNLVIGGDYEIFGRPEWRALERAYGLHFREQRQMQPAFMYKAVADGDLDVITAFSSDARVARYDLLLLSDPKQAIPPYDAVLLLAPSRRTDAKFVEALKPLVGRIPIARMREANLMVSRADNQAAPADAARWLWQQIAGE
jgi:osmoprotectant transport system substrate-binding protein/osmoprotectant transport system permease protein